MIIYLNKKILIEVCPKAYPAFDILNILPKSSKILPRSCKFWEGLRRNPRSCQDIRDPRSYQDFQDETQDLTKKFKTSRQNLRSFQDIQEFKIFLRSCQDIQDVERWVLLF